MRTLRRKFVCLTIAVAALSAAVVIAAPASGANTGATESVSVNPSGDQGNFLSYDASISADGRFVAFSSSASNLVAGDTNGDSDILVRDLTTGATVRVSISSSGAQANNSSLGPSISADGRYVTFWSDASNLVAGDTNGDSDVFVHDRMSGTTERVSIVSSGTQGDNDSYEPSISADGRYVAFESSASDLVAGDTNFTLDVFVHDRTTGATERVSVDSSGTGASGSGYSASISADGRYVVFTSASSDLVAGDTNRLPDVFLRDRTTGTTELVSVDSEGGQANGNSGGGSISADGRYVLFGSSASDLVAGDTNGWSDGFLRDRTTGTTELVSVDSEGGQANGNSGGGSISADGRYVAFESSASDLVAGDTNFANDIFFQDRLSGVTERVSIDSAGTQANGFSGSPSIDAGGRYVAFHSDASNLVVGDSNQTVDVFVHDRAPSDSDGDGVSDVADNCPDDPNEDQGDIDRDGTGDVCDPDSEPIITAPRNPFVTDTSFTVAWEATDESSAAATYDVRYRDANYNADFGAYTAWLTATESTQASFIGTPGHTYCFSVRATDNDGNVSGYGVEGCAFVPLDDLSLSRTGAWSTRSDPDYYFGGVSRSSTEQARLTLEGVQASSIALLVARCNTCGKVRVLFNRRGISKLGTPQTSVSLDCECQTERTRRRILFNPLGAVKTGTVEIRVLSSDESVRIDGLYVTRILPE